MRGAPGSGKSYISKMIKDKEQEMGGSARILSIDDYFMTETDSETTTVRKVSDSVQLLRSFDSNLNGIPFSSKCRLHPNNLHMNSIPNRKKRTHNV